jgi:hypothetical protein
LVLIISDKFEVSSLIWGRIMASKDEVYDGQDWFFVLVPISTLSHFLSSSSKIILHRPAPLYSSSTYQCQQFSRGNAESAPLPFKLALAPLSSRYFSSEYHYRT